MTETDKTTKEQRRKIVQLPANADLQLIAPLWFSAGVAALFHSLLRKSPLRLLAPADVRGGYCLCATYAEEGLALLMDAASLAPDEVTAMQQLIEAALQPHGFDSTYHHGSPGGRPSHLVILHTPVDDREFDPWGLANVPARLAAQGRSPEEEARTTLQKLHAGGVEPGAE
jgi:hypothetical protein